jgi:hypothetical protein
MTEVTRSPFDRKHDITITIDEAALAKVTDQVLALWWHVAQANPANGFAARGPGDVAEKVGREIIRRWLAKAPVELWHHQGHHNYWDQLRKLGKWNADREFVPHAPVPDPEIVKQALEDAAIYRMVHHPVAGDERAARYDEARAMLDAPAAEDGEAGHG